MTEWSNPAGSSPGPRKDLLESTLRFIGSRSRFGTATDCRKPARPGDKESDKEKGSRLGAELCGGDFRAHSWIGAIALGLGEGRPLFVFAVVLPDPACQRLLENWGHWENGKDVAFDDSAIGLTRVIYRNMIDLR